MDYYLGEIRLFAGNFAPEGWAICDGRLLPIANYQALFSLFGTFWGGDGVTTFGIPDFRGRIPVGQGQGSALSPRTIGQKNGAENVGLVAPEMPAHSHPFNVALTGATTNIPSSSVILAEPINGDEMYLPDSSAGQATDVVYGAQSIANSGASGLHNNIMPSVAVTYIIALDGGIYPTRAN